MDCAPSSKRAWGGRNGCAALGRRGLESMYRYGGRWDWGRGRGRYRGLGGGAADVQGIDGHASQPLHLDEYTEEYIQRLCLTLLHRVLCGCYQPGVLFDIITPCIVYMLSTQRFQVVAPVIDVFG